MIEKCSPVEMGKNLKMVEVLKENMVDFVPIPCLNTEDKKNFIKLLQEQLKKAEEVI